MVVDGIAKFQALKSKFLRDSEISSKIPYFAGNFGIPQKFQALKFQNAGSEISSKIPYFAGNFGIPQKFQALKFQNSGPEIWRIRPPPFHTPPFACRR